MAASWARLLVTGLVICLLGRPSQGQGDDDDLIQYCADIDGGVQFISDNVGSFSDGAVDTGMGIYKENSNCKWIIKPTINEQRKQSLKRVVLSFQYLSMEAGYDFVRVYETNQGGKLIGIFTGATIPPVLVGTVDTMYVQFETDATGQRNGFRADWHTTGCPNACGNRGSCVFDYCYCDEGAFGGDCTSTFCVGTKKYTSIVGSLMDHYRQLDEFGVLITGPDECPPSNPNCEYTYQNNADCRWLVKPLQLSASYFTIEFLLFDTEVGRDLFILYDGENMNSPVLLQASGNLTLPMMASSGGDVFIRFKTDKIQRRLGFFVQWDTLLECGGPTGYCMDGGTKYDGTQRPNQGWCRDPSTWAPQHDVKGRCECEFGWYGGDCSSNFCVGWAQLRNRSGELVDHQDSTSVVLDEQGRNKTVHITNSQYRATSFCRWYINPEPQAYGIDYLGMPNSPDLYSPVNFIVITADYFELEPGADFLTIYNGPFYNNTRILANNYHQQVVDGVLTGSGMQVLPEGRILSAGPKLFLQFATDNANANFQAKSTSPRNHLRGFHLKYEGVLCAGLKTVTSPYGNITDGATNGRRYYPRAYCQWLISPDPNQFLQPAAGLDIRIKRMDIAYDKLTVYDGNSTASPFLGRYSQNLIMNGATELLLTSTSGQVLVEWNVGCSSSKNCLRPHCECDVFGTGWSVEWNLRPGKTMDHIKYSLGPLDIWFRPTWIPYVDVPGKSVVEVPGYCSSAYPVNLTAPIGELSDRTFNSSHSYYNSADCSWYIDIQSDLQQLDLYLEYLDLDTGYTASSSGSQADNEPADELFIYRGFIEDETNSTGNLLARLTGKIVTGQTSGNTPTVWSVLHGWSNESSVGMMIRFKSSPNIVRTGFKLRWESRITSPMFTTATGSGTVGNSAGHLSDVEVQTMWIPFCQSPQPPYPRICYTSDSASADVPGKCSSVSMCTPNCSWSWWDSGSPNFEVAPADRHPTPQDIRICKMEQPGAQIRMRFNYGQVLPTATPLIKNRSRTEIVWADGSHAGGGRYTMSYISKYAGLHVMTISQHSDFSILNTLPPINHAEGVMLFGSPFTVSTTFTATDPRQTQVEEIPQESELAVGGLVGGKAGYSYSFRVNAFDMFGNKVTDGDPRSCPLAPNGYPCPTTVVSVKLDSGTALIWGTVMDQGDGSFLATYEASTAGVYQTHIRFLVNSEDTGLNSLVAVRGSPFTTAIVKVPCPRAGDEYPCNDQGTCEDSGVCVCESGWKGDYCQEDITAFLTLVIIMENAAVVAFILALIIRAVWIHFFVEKQMWERLQYEDIEEDW